MNPKTHRVILLVLLFSGSMFESLSACPVCMPLPRKTVADKLIESQDVVFVRENPTRPFTCKVLQTLKGNPGTGSIDYFVDSATRRTLRINSKQVMVLYRPKSEEDWASLGIADEETQQVYQRIIVFAPEWNDKQGQEKRLEYFLSLFGHENRTLFELAYLELGRAPYSKVKRYARRVHREKLDLILTQRRYYEWRPLAILMLAQQTQNRDQELIRKSYQACSRFNQTTNLSAWTTAFLEIDRENALRLIEMDYLLNKKRSSIEIQAVLKALKMHEHSGNSEWRNSISDSIQKTIQTHPGIVQGRKEQIADHQRYRASSK